MCIVSTMLLLKLVAASCVEKFDAEVATPVRDRGDGQSLGSSFGSETDKSRGDPLRLGSQAADGAGLYRNWRTCFERVPMLMTSLPSLLFGILFSACQESHEVRGKAEYLLGLITRWP